jgi:hypothetical protein
MIKLHQLKIWRETHKFLNRVRREEFKTTSLLSWHRIPGLPQWAGRRNEYLEFQPEPNGTIIRYNKSKTPLPHEIAESEEKDTSPNWGEISETDTGLDSTEDEVSSFEKKTNN